MVAGYKTGGRRPGSKNKPKTPAPVDTPVDASVAATVEAAAAAAAPPAAHETVTRTPARARQAVGPAADGGLPPYRKERVANLVPFERNARTHSAASIDKLAELIAKFGWTSPILVAGRNIIAGHARRLAAMKLGIEVVPVIDLKHLTPLEREACILADNRAALDGGWDDELLFEGLDKLREGGLLEYSGFDLGELSNLFGEGDPPEPPPVRTTAKTVECPKCHYAFAP